MFRSSNISSDKKLGHEWVHIKDENRDTKEGGKFH